MRIRLPLFSLSQFLIKYYKNSKDLGEVNLPFGIKKNVNYYLAVALFHREDSVELL